MIKSTAIGVFPKCFHAEFSDKNICHYSKRAQTCHLLCKRPGCYHSTSKTHLKGRIFKLSPIHASVFKIRFPEFAEFTEFKESSAQFKKNSIEIWVWTERFVIQTQEL